MSAYLDESAENDVTHPETLCDGSEGPVPIVALLFTLAADSPGQEVC